MAVALKYVHESGIIHGAVRPSNILIDNEQHPVLSDFSSAKIVGDGSELEQPILQELSCRYDAPETRDGDFSAASDIYSWAMSAVEIISGRKDKFIASILWGFTENR